MLGFKHFLAFCVLAGSVLATPAMAQDATPEGLWLTENQRSVINVKSCPEGLCGTIHWIIDGGMHFDEQNEDPALRTTPMCGLKILWGFKQQDAKNWIDGKIYKADEGDMYNLTGCSNTANQTVAYANTQVLSSSGASRCGTGSVALTATANAGNTINWYTASSGGSAVATGGTFNTPSLTSTTTYYVAAEAINAGATITVGSGANTPFSYEGVFYHLFGGNQTQFLIRASELQAAGLASGNITQLGIRFLSVASHANNGFAISMMATANTDMSGGLNTGAFTSVYSVATVTPAGGLNTFTLSTPFNWNGTSNVIIKMCWSNNNTGGTSNYAQVDATGYVSCAYYRADSQTPATICGGTTATSTVSSRPQFYFTGNGLTLHR